MQSAGHRLGGGGQLDLSLPLFLLWPYWVRLLFLFLTIACLLRWAMEKNCRTLGTIQPHPTPSPSPSPAPVSLVEMVWYKESCLGSQVRDQNSAGFHILCFSFPNWQKEDGKQERPAGKYTKLTLGKPKTAGSSCLLNQSPSDTPSLNTTWGQIHSLTSFHLKVCSKSCFWVQLGAISQNLD